MVPQRLRLNATTIVGFTVALLTTTACHHTPKASLRQFLAVAADALLAHSSNRHLKTLLHADRRPPSRCPTDERTHRPYRPIVATPNLVLVRESAACSDRRFVSGPSVDSQAGSSDSSSESPAETFIRTHQFNVVRHKRAMVFDQYTDTDRTQMRLTFMWRQGTHSLVYSL